MCVFIISYVQYLQVYSDTDVTQRSIAITKGAIWMSIILYCICINFKENTRQISNICVTPLHFHWQPPITPQTMSKIMRCITLFLLEVMGEGDLVLPSLSSVLWCAMRSIWLFYDGFKKIYSLNGLEIEDIAVYRRWCPTLHALAPMELTPVKPYKKPLYALHTLSLFNCIGFQIHIYAANCILYNGFHAICHDLWQIQKFSEWISGLCNMPRGTDIIIEFASGNKWKSLALHSAWSILTQGHILGVMVEYLQHTMQNALSF